MMAQRRCSGIASLAMVLLSLSFSNAQMQSMPGMGGMPPMGGAGGMPPMGGMSQMGGMPQMGMPPMGGAGGMPPMQGMGGAGGMPPMPGMGGGMPGGPAPMPQPSGQMPPGGGYPNVQSSHCRYLVNAPSPWGTNASPFKLYTRSYSGVIRRGYPVEVAIMPMYKAFKFFNFSDFAMWAESHPIGTPGGPPPNVPPHTHLGVWQVFPQYAGGAGSMKCNVYSRGEDTVGSFEGRLLELLKTQYPMDNRLAAFSPSARHGAAFLWYPDERTMSSATAVKFVAKLKSYGQWFTLESTPWSVYRPPPPRPRHTQSEPRDFGSMMDQYQNMRNQMRYMEHRLETAGAPNV